MSNPRKMNGRRARGASLSLAVLVGVTGVTLSKLASAASDSSKSDDSFEPTTPAEKRAYRLDTEALGPDFRARRFTAGEKKIRDAIQVCMIQTCANAFKARLHRDLGYLYVAGLKRVEDGKDEFTAALTMDAGVALSPEMQEQPGVKQAFEDVRAEMNGSSPAGDTKPTDSEGANKDIKGDEPSEPEPPKAKSQKKEQPEKQNDSTAIEESFPEAAPPPKKAFLNWLTLGIEQDFVIHQNTPYACSTGSRYTCFDRQQRSYTIDQFAPGGNQVSGGLAAGVWRILLGYDRVFANRFSIGARLGTVVYGKPEIVKGDRAYLSVHGEARVAAWLMSDSFEQPGLRPYIFVSGGAAENDGRVVVQVSWDRCPNCKLNAWKRSGPAFVGGGAGLQWAITPRTGPVLEARYLQFLSPALPSVGVQLGYAVGL